MVTESHMTTLREELENLRDRVRAGDASVEDVRSLQHVASRMLTDGLDGPYESALEQVNDLLDVITRNMFNQARLQRMAEAGRAG